MRFLRVLSAAALLAACGSAWSHAALTRSVPGNREVLAQSPVRVSLTFNERVEAKFSRVSLEDAQGAPRAIDAPTVGADNPYRLDAVLPTALEAGRYTVRYRVLSQDGHVIERAFSFTVQAADAAP